jgi:hypothetical protein
VSSAKRISSVVDDFQAGPSPYWGRFAIGSGRIQESPGFIRFNIEGASAEILSDAEIGDYHGPRRDRLPWRPPLLLEVRARFSHAGDQLLGTAGFGFWNKPFEDGYIATPPQALWFFFASPPSHMSLDARLPGYGWKAASLNSGRPPGWVVSIGNILLGLPVFSPLAYRVARGVVASHEAYLDWSSLTAWHDFEIEWRRDEAYFRVDRQEVYRAANPPAAPLGFVAWMDNQYGTIGPTGPMEFGRLTIPQRQWLEIDRVSIESLA